VTQAEYDAVAGDLMALAQSIEDSKRPGYTVGAEDVLANFKRTADRAGVDVGQAWAVFFLKHIDAILSIMTRPDLPQAEEPPGRFADAINYLRLGYALLHERQCAESSSPVVAAASQVLSVPAEPTFTSGLVSVAPGSTTTQPSAATVGAADYVRVGPCQYVWTEMVWK
jgi:hypothetical protein